MKTKKLSTTFVILITAILTLAVVCLSLFVVPVYHQSFKAYDTFGSRWYDHPAYWSCVTCKEPLIPVEYQWESLLTNH